MSSTLRLSIIMVLLLATAALGLVAYSNMNPKPVVQVTENTPAPAPLVGYFVAARPLPIGTLAREEDFAVRSVPSDSVPTGAILDTPDARIGLRGSLVRKFLDTGSPVTSQDLSHPGFLASVLAPDSRAISIKVDAESSVSGLIRPGDYVDVVSTKMIEKHYAKYITEHSDDISRHALLHHEPPAADNVVALARGDLARLAVTA